MWSDVLVYIRSWVACAPIISRVLFDLKFNPVLSVLILRIRHIKLPNRILPILSLIFRRRYLPRLQIILAMLRSVILIRKLDYAITVGP